GPAVVIGSRLGQLGDAGLEGPPAVVGVAVGARGVAGVDPFEDDGDLPVAEGDVVVDVRQVPAGDGGVAGGDVLAARHAGARGRGPGQGGDLVARLGPVDEQHAHVGQRVAQGAQLPVEDG